MLDGTTYHLPLARGWTTYEIQKAGETDPGKDPQDTSKPQDTNEPQGTDKTSDPSKGEEEAIKTGDTAQASLWIYSGIAALLVIAATIVYRRKRR